MDYTYIATISLASNDRSVSHDTVIDNGSTSGTSVVSFELSRVSLLPEVKTAMGNRKFTTKQLIIFFPKQIKKVMHII